MIEFKDIILEENQSETYNFNHGYINKPVKIFGKIGFEREDEKLGICVPKGVPIESLLSGLNDYLMFLSDCKILLMDYYKKENSSMIQEWYEGKMTGDWYETLELYGGTIDFDKEGNPHGRFSCGDNMIADHLLCIEFNGREISEMWFDG